MERRGILGTESYPPTRQQSVQPQPPWQSMPPQPPFGRSVRPQPPSGQGVRPQPQGALPPPLGQNVLPARLPTLADLDRRQPPPPRVTFPAAVSPVQSPPEPPRQPQQQQQQEGYRQRHGYQGTESTISHSLISSSLEQVRGMVLVRASMVILERYSIRRSCEIRALVLWLQGRAGRGSRVRIIRG